MSETELMPCRCGGLQTRIYPSDTVVFDRDADTKTPIAWYLSHTCVLDGNARAGIQMTAPTKVELIAAWNRRSPVAEGGGSGAQVPRPIASTAGSVPVSDYAIRRAAAALCRLHGLNPDCLHWHEPGEKNRRDNQPWPDDATLENGKLAHFGWRHKVPDVRAVIAAFTAPKQEGASDTGEQK